MKNEKGMTLVELLASLVLLALVITVFLQFLPQLGTTNKKNVEKNQAINLAEEELLYWKNHISENFDSFLGSAITTNCSFDKSEICYVLEKLDMQDVDYNKDFYVSINLQINPEPELNKTKAYRLHLEIKNRENDAKVSESFGFVYH